MDLPTEPAVSNSAVSLGHAFCLLALVLTASGVRLPAQENPCLTRTVPVNVTTEDCRRILGLTSPNFRGKFRGRPVEIISAKYDTGPRRVVILLDASGSMEYAWSIELTVARNLVASAPAKDSFAVLTFADRIDKTIGFGQGNKAVVDAFIRLAGERRTGGKTVLLDALVAGLELLRPVNMGDVIYVITDGEDNGSRSHEAEVKSLLFASAVRVFALIRRETRREDTSTPGGHMPIRFPDITEGTGGDSLMFLAPEYGDALLPFSDRFDRKIMSPAAFAFGREISEFYAVQVKLPEAVDKARDWRLEVVPPENEKLPHLRVVYPRRLAPCP